MNPWKAFLFLLVLLLPGGSLLLLAFATAKALHFGKDRLTKSGPAPMQPMPMAAGGEGKA